MSPVFKSLLLVILCIAAVLHDYVREGFNFPAASVIVFPLILAGFRPRQAWLWGIVAGVAGALGFWLFKYWSTGTLPPNPVASLIGVVPALAAAYIGAWIRKIRDDLDATDKYSEI